MHAALRPAGRPRRVRQQRHVGAAGGDRSRPFAGGERIGEGDEAGTAHRRAGRGDRRRQRDVGLAFERIGVRGDDDGSERVRHIAGEARGDLLAGDGDRRAAVLEVDAELLRNEHRVERDDDRVGPQDRVVGDDVLRRVLHREHDAVAAADAGPVDEVTRERFDLLPQPAIRDRRVVVDDRRVVGEACRRRREVVREVRLRDREGERPALRPEGKVALVHQRDADRCSARCTSGPPPSSRLRGRRSCRASIVRITCEYDEMMIDWVKAEPRR